MFCTIAQNDQDYFKAGMCNLKQIVTYYNINTLKKKALLELIIKAISPSFRNHLTYWNFSSSLQFASTNARQLPLSLLKLLWPQIKYSWYAFGINLKKYVIPIMLYLRFLWICEIWGNFSKNRYFAKNYFIKVRISEFLFIHVTHLIVNILGTANFVSIKLIFS